MSDIEKQLGGLGWGEGGGAGYCEHLCSATNHYKSRGDGGKKEKERANALRGGKTVLTLGCTIQALF